MSSRIFYFYEETVCKKLIHTNSSSMKLGSTGRTAVKSPACIFYINYSLARVREITLIRPGRSADIKYNTYSFKISTHNPIGKTSKTGKFLNGMKILKFKLSITGWS